tara:strand:+ start:189 stop:371 length:183 start_codon:yes stop_codon:yes gene_type:complete
MYAFFNWAVREWSITNPLAKVDAPRVPEKPIEPYTKLEIRELAEACEKKRRWGGATNARR